MSEQKAELSVRSWTEELRYLIVGLANTAGGIIRIGMEEGRVFGVDNAEAVKAKIKKLIQQDICPDPGGFTEINIVAAGQAKLIELHIRRGNRCPYFLRAEGMCSAGVYVWNGKTAVLLTESDIQLALKQTGTRFETARCRNQNLTFTFAERWFKTNRLPFDRAEQQKLHLIGEDGMYTNLALLLSDQCTHITRAVHTGDERNGTAERNLFSGSLLAQLQDAGTWIREHNGSCTDVICAKRVTRKDYPESAVQEALVNAFLHRDYDFPDPTLIKLADDRLEIVTPGGLAEHLTAADVELGISVCRNPYLAAVLYRLNLCDLGGVGMLKIRNSYAGADNQMQFMTSEHAFRMILPNRNTHTRTILANMEIPPDTGALDRQRQVIHMAERKGRIIRKDVESALHISQSSAILLLREMTAQGLLTKEGAGKKRIYRAAS